MAASPVQGNNSYTTVGSLPQGGERTETSFLAKSNIDNTNTPHPHPERAFKQRPIGFYCRSVGCTRDALVSAPVGAGSMEQACRRQRRVLVDINCHLYRVAASLSSKDFNSTPCSLSGVCAERRDTAVLLEAPRGWALGDKVSMGIGRWVSSDGLVYAPLFYSSKCGSVQVGEKAVGAGLGGENLIGRAWFFPSQVEPEGDLDYSASPKVLELPTSAAPLV